MTDTDLYALYALDGSGKGERLQPAENGASRPGTSALWCKLNREYQGLADSLSKITDSDEVMVEALTAEDPRPRCVAHGGGALVILRGINLNPGSDPEDMVSVRIWVDAGRVFTVQGRKLVAIDDLIHMLDQGTGPKTPGDFIVMLADGLTDYMQTTIEEIDEALDTLEDEQDGGEIATLRSRIAQLHRRVVTLRRFIAPQRDALGTLIREPFAWKSKAHERRLKEIVDRVMRLVEQLDEIHARAVIARESLAGFIAERLNRTMALLSIVASVFLPLTFITGLLGINVSGIPFADSDWAFAIVVGGLVVVGVFEVLLFRRFRLL
ncbi:MAG: zinc transporter ZntB [Rhodospirillaceae bacterium]|nr:zinc transporter ZntB [Rhodospirillaceae bacterium]